MATLSPDQKSLLAALAQAQASVPKGEHKEFLTASSFGGVTVILPDGANLPLDTTDLDVLAEAGFVKLTAHRDHGDVNGFVTSAGIAFLEAEATHSVQSASQASESGASNVKRSASVFYSWQSDISPGAACRSLIEGALNESVKRVAGDGSLDVEPVIDRDTANVPGAPDIGTTILAKIESAAIFVADVTIVGVATDDEVIQFHRHHRDPEIHSVTLGRFFAQTVSAEDAQGQRARG